LALFDQLARAAARSGDGETRSSRRGFLRGLALAGGTAVAVAAVPEAVAGAATATCGSLTSCNGVCTNLKTDLHNCGKCGKTCPGGQVCIKGACVVSCSPSQKNCHGVCTCTLIDPHNCGACGHVCASGQTCAKGKCA
jgi:hypothetical protein